MTIWQSIQTWKETRVEWKRPTQMDELGKQTGMMRNEEKNGNPCIETSEKCAASLNNGKFAKLE